MTESCSFTVNNYINSNVIFSDPLSNRFDLETSFLFIPSVSEPRTTVTREFLHSGRYQSISNPTSPSQVVLNERQGLENILNPRNPIVPETVAMNQEVQRVDQALDEFQNRRMRARKKIDYAKLHNFGR